MMSSQKSNELSFKEIEPRIIAEYIRYHKISINLAAVGYEQLAKKYECENCFEKIVAMPAVKCMNCQKNFYCQKCFYTTTMSNCRNCFETRSLPEQLTPEEKNELSLILLKCENHAKGCKEVLPYMFYHEHGMECPYNSDDQKIPIQTKYFIQHEYQRNQNKRLNLPKIKEDHMIDTIGLNSHLKHPNPITMRFNTDIRTNFDVKIENASTGYEKLAEKYRCIICKKLDRDVMPKNEVRKCGYCNGMFCLSCYYKNTPQLHCNDCPQCFNDLICPAYLNKKELEELKSIKFKCDNYKNGCKEEKLYYDISLHSIDCQFKLKKAVATTPTSVFNQINNASNTNQINANFMPFNYSNSIFKNNLNCENKNNINSFVPTDVRSVNNIPFNSNIRLNSKEVAKNSNHFEDSSTHKKIRESVTDNKTIFNNNNIQPNISRNDFIAKKTKKNEEEEEEEINRKNDNVNKKESILEQQSYNKSESNFNVPDKTLLAFTEKELNSHTIEELKGILRVRNIKINSGSKKGDLLLKINQFLKEKYSDKEVKSLLEKGFLDKFKMDELKGILCLKGLSYSIEGNKTKTDLIGKIISYLKNKK